MHERVVAIAADYADALLVVRRAKRLLLLLLMLTLIAQVAIFACVHFKLLKGTQPSAVAATSVETSTTVATGSLPSTTTMPSRTAAVENDVRSSLSSIGTSVSKAPTEWLTYLTVVTLTGGVVLGILLSLTLFLTVHIMLVGRLIGVAYVTRAFVLSLLLTLLLFPWQTVLATTGLRDAVLPGALYTWGEISERVPMTEGDMAHQIMYWARFVAWPLIALIVLLLVQVRSGTGLKLALGEEEVLAVDSVGGDVHTVVR